ncbi:LVIVD repeat-containing protein [Membranihabitans maritimus]|uniref:LVIVD repeat-containing protein n=1 Tax=Membranihabitans maritimus TaxID=2904244 RepID=UPI001F35A0E2|nr:hypothetical protein [Membranihabitans maritimus]
MKKFTKILFLSFMVFSAFSCLKDECAETMEFYRFDPVYLSKTEYNAPIEVGSPRTLENPGILYSYKNYILINEINKGIHVIDNTDPTNPQFISFVSILGNTHFSIRNDQMYANKFGHLLSIDFSDPINPVETSRIANVSEDVQYHENKGFLAYYERTELTRSLDCADPRFNSVRWTDRGTGQVWWGAGRPEFAFMDQTGRPLTNANFSSSKSAGGGNVSGTGGSMARITLANDYLYWVNNHQLMTFDLADKKNPRSTGKLDIGWNIETIYPFKEKLFIGSSSGMFIYDVSNAAEPRYESSFSHATACDPVVTDGTTAYVTLRSGNECDGFVNQMDAVDVSQTSSPYLVKTYPMIQPHGLSLTEDGIIYLCEGPYGLKVLNAKDRGDIKTEKHIKGFHAYDAIALSNELLLIIGDDGFIQYDVTNPASPKRLSIIPVEKS